MEKFYTVRISEHDTVFGNYPKLRKDIIDKFGEVEIVEFTTADGNEVCNISRAQKAIFLDRLGDLVKIYFDNTENMGLSSLPLHADDLFSIESWKVEYRLNIVESVFGCIFGLISCILFNKDLESINARAEEEIASILKSKDHFVKLAGEIANYLPGEITANGLLERMKYLLISNYTYLDGMKQLRTRWKSDFGLKRMIEFTKFRDPHSEIVYVYLDEKAKTILKSKLPYIIKYAINARGTAKPFKHSFRLFSREGVDVTCSDAEDFIIYTLLNDIEILIKNIKWTILNTRFTINPGTVSQTCLEEMYTVAEAAVNAGVFCDMCYHGEQVGNSTVTRLLETLYVPDVPTGSRTKPAVIHTTTE